MLFLGLDQTHGKSVCLKSELWGLDSNPEVKKRKFCYNFNVKLRNLEKMTVGRMNPEIKSVSWIFMWRQVVMMVVRRQEKHS